jgi:Ankyrin repeat
MMMQESTHSNSLFRLTRERSRTTKLRLWANQETFSEEQFTPLHIAAYNGNVKILSYLIDNCGADPHRAQNS